VVIDHEIGVINLVIDRIERTVDEAGEAVEQPEIPGDGHDA
jgi:hypothetical protein